MQRRHVYKALARAIFLCALLGRALGRIDCGSAGAVSNRFCANDTYCVSNLSNSGTKFGCAKLSTLVCDDARFSCPEGFSCDVAASRCVSDTGLEVGLQTNIDAHFVTNTTKQFCDYIANGLPVRCQCTNGHFGGTVNCEVGVFSKDRLGLQIDISPCDAPAHIDLMVTEAKHHANLTLESVKAGDEKDIPIPGMAVGIPKLGNVGIDASVLVDGNLDNLTLQVGLNACAEVSGQHVCGSKLTKLLPLWILEGTYEFGHICNPSEKEYIVV